MFNSIYPGEVQTGPQTGFYGMEGQPGGYGAQPEDPYSVSYYQAAAAAQYRQWEENSKEGQFNSWSNGQAPKPTPTQSDPVPTQPVPASGTSPTPFYQGQDNSEAFRSSPATHNLDKNLPGKKILFFKDITVILNFSIFYYIKYILSYF